MSNIFKIFVIMRPLYLQIYYRIGDDLYLKNKFIELKFKFKFDYFLMTCTSPDEIPSLS